MSSKGLISRMSDECLRTLETVFSYCYDCQAVMRKFTLAGKSLFAICQEAGSCHCYCPAEMKEMAESYFLNTYGTNGSRWGGN